MSARDLPLLRVGGALRTALSEDVLGALDPDDLGRYLRSRRWFGAKGETLRSIRFRDSTPLFGDPLPSAVARLEVDLGASRPATYQLPLAIARAGAEAPESALARIEARDGSAYLFDAVEEPGFRERLAATFATGASFPGRSARFVVAPLDERGRRAVEPGNAGTIARGEQSNTSIFYGTGAILKLYRRLEAGENPDVEIGRFLTTEASFANVPRLLGTIHVHDADGTSAVAGMLQELVAGSEDAWKYTLGRLARLLQTSTDDPPFAAEAERLGAVTRGLHEALASSPAHPEFAPEPVGRDDLEAWKAAVRLQVERALALLEREGASAPQARQLLPRRNDALEKIERAASVPPAEAGMKIRHHGDYHLGQVLRREDGEFLIIDFEGEPARPLAERRRRHSPLRDVSGMLRSFDYAAGATLRERRADAAARPRAARWAREARDAFLRGYRAQARSAALPASSRAFDALLALFELEKAFYELAYELNNRPSWVDIPLGGIRAILDAPR